MYFLNYQGDIRYYNCRARGSVAGFGNACPFAEVAEVAGVFPLEDSADVYSHWV